MRWLMIGLLVSLVALLVAAAGVARHIWLEHRADARKPVNAAGAGKVLAPDGAEDADLEIEP